MTQASKLCCYFATCNLHSSLFSYRIDWLRTNCKLQTIQGSLCKSADSQTQIQWLLINAKWPTKNKTQTVYDQKRQTIAFLLVSSLFSCCNINIIVVVAVVIICYGKLAWLALVVVLGGLVSRSSWINKPSCLWASQQRNLQVAIGNIEPELFGLT